MSQTSKYPGPLSLDPETVRVCGHFTTNSGGDPIVASHAIRGASAVTKTAAGKYKVALSDDYPGGLLTMGYCVQGLVCGVENDTSTNQTSPHVDLLFELTDGTDTNVISKTCYINMIFERRA